MSHKVVKKKTYAGFGYDCCKFIDVKTCRIEEQLIVGKFFMG
jgi:hypothetical protein